MNSVRKKNEVILLVGASEAFNAVNRKTFLHNIDIIFPPIAKYIPNCYNLPYRLFITSGREIQSTKGAPQDDPNAMAIYAIAIIPLVPMMANITRQDIHLQK